MTVLARLMQKLCVPFGAPFGGRYHRGSLNRQQSLKLPGHCSPEAVFPLVQMSSAVVSDIRFSLVVSPLRLVNGEKTDGVISSCRWLDRPAQA